jgi:hypothetical protein
VEIPELPDPLFKPWAAPVFSTAYYDICWFFSSIDEFVRCFSGGLCLLLGSSFCLSGSLYHVV